MDNKLFDVEYSPENVGLKSLIVRGDQYKMNWVESDTAVFGIPYLRYQSAFNRIEELIFKNADIKGDICRAVYENNFVRVDVTRENGKRYSETYTFTNISSNEIFFEMGNIGIDIPFNDNYESAETCLTKRCNTHIWCGKESSYIMAMRMGKSKLNVGLVLTSGSVGAYTQTTPPYAKNDRGDFRLDFSPFSLLPGESYTYSHELFVFADRTDFFDKIKEYKNFIDVKLSHQTIFFDEVLKVTCCVHDIIKSNFVTVNSKKIETTVDGKCLSFEYIPDTLGDLKIEIEINGIKTNALAFVSPSLSELCEKRIKFICDKQQYHKKGSQLDGAYLIYDNETDSMYFNNMVYDYNASRERLGMGILIAKYLQDYPNEQFLTSLMKYTDFVFREFVDTETGEVFDTIGKDPSQIRLYNAPWVAMFCTELFKLTKDKEYLSVMARVMDMYYNSGGDHFYPNGISISELIDILYDNDMPKEAESLFAKSRIHTDNMVSNGIFYPKHEVDYEQTIVTPAVTFMLELYKLTGVENYLSSAKEHMENLIRFDSLAPDYHLYETPIRHWDDYWFGKEQTFGDTFPHYWSVLSGWAYRLYAEAANDKTFESMAEDNIRNCLCLFTPEGRASCAYLYPFRIGDKRGKLFDPYANDQDFALYFALKLFEKINNSDSEK